MRVDALDHIVLCVRDVPTTIEFYERVMGMEAREERPGKWSLHFGRNKISLQDAAASPTIAEDTIPGTGNFCLLTEIPMDEVVAHLARRGDLGRGRPRRAGGSDGGDPLGLLPRSGRQSRRAQQRDHTDLSASTGARRAARSAG